MSWGGMRSFTVISVLLSMAACQSTPTWNGSLESLLEAHPKRFATVASDPEHYRVQIIYTQIDRDSANRPSFRSFSYRLDPDEYFYPASTVKLPTAALALEKLTQLNIPGLDRNTEMQTAAGPTNPQTQSAANAQDFPPSVATFVRQILSVSDNEAFNRLYEFLGQKALNEALRAKGLQHTRIIHRLEVSLTEEQNRETNAVRFVSKGQAVYEQPARHSDIRFAGAEPELLGVAEIINGERVTQPKDFSSKNKFALQDLHDTVKALVFPESVAPARRYNFSDEDHRFLLKGMSGLPRESGFASYADASAYPDGYVKFLLYGGTAPDIPAHIRIFNKVGDAYGFLTDAAYVVDFDSGVEFLLAATIYTNANQTFNDDTYEYAETGLPFLRDLGQTILQLERDRPRRFVPDLSSLQKISESASW